MNGVPPEVLARRVASALQRAVAYNEAKDAESTRVALFEARDWLNRLREAMR